MLRAAGSAATHRGATTGSLRDSQSQEVLAGSLTSTSGMVLRTGGKRDVVWQRGQRARAAASRRRVPRLELRAAGEAIMEAKEAIDSDDEADLVITRGTVSARPSSKVAPRNSERAAGASGSFTSRR